jgi:hypothetical protein
MLEERDEDDKALLAEDERDADADESLFAVFKWTDEGAEDELERPDEDTGTLEERDADDEDCTEDEADYERETEAEALELLERTDECTEDELDPADKDIGTLEEWDADDEEDAVEEVRAEDEWDADADDEELLLAALGRIDEDWDEYAELDRPDEKTGTLEERVDGAEDAGAVVRQ